MERTLHVDLDECSLDEDGLALLLHRLASAGVPPKSVGNCGSALRAYGDFAAGRR